MGLLRALLIVSVIYAVWQIVDVKLLQNIPLESRAKWVPWIPIALVFVVELLL